MLSLTLTKVLWDFWDFDTFKKKLFAWCWLAYQFAAVSRPDYMQVESSSCFTKELVSFDPWHVTCSPKIGKRIRVGLHNNFHCLLSVHGLMNWKQITMTTFISLLCVVTCIVSQCFFWRSVVSCKSFCEMSQNRALKGGLKLSCTSPS